jgi:PAS domain-containing protein
MRDLLQCSSACIIHLDESGKVLFANKRSQELLGLEKESNMLKLFGDILQKDLLIG